MTPAPVAVALDAADLETAVAWAEAVGPHVSTIKVGLELYLRHGADAVVKTREASA
ncbi:MAG: orotidine 5'-phosphate decarboxylase / HUMPS family protein, partial [Actinomycetes bacterium]